jgi:hypothetical protein
MKEQCLEFETSDGRIIHLRCVKALYGHIEAARLFYDDLNTPLNLKMGFARSQYAPCVCNRKTKDRQVLYRQMLMTLKYSSVSEKQLDVAIGDLGNIYQIIVVENNTHDYLGMIMMHDIGNQKG